MMKKSFKEIMLWYLSNLGREGISPGSQKTRYSTAHGLLIPELGDKWLSHGQLKGRERLVRGDVVALKTRLLNEGKADATVAKYILLGCTAINRAKEYRDWDLPNPFEGTGKGLERAYREREVTSDEETRIMFRFEYSDVLLVMLDTGARSGEILGLKWNQLLKDDNGHYIKLRFKTNKWRKIYLTDRAYRLIITRPVITEYVFVDKFGERIKYNNFIRQFHRARESAGVDHCTPHDFRRTFGYRKRRDGVELDAIQAQLGHASRSTTERVYAKVDEEKAWDAVLACGKAL